jgi:hypothetical protein
MFDHTFDNLENSGFFISTHGLDDKVVVAGEEEEAAGLAGTLATLEDVV